MARAKKPIRAEGSVSPMGRAKKEVEAAEASIALMLDNILGVMKSDKDRRFAALELAGERLIKGLESVTFLKELSERMAAEGRSDESRELAKSGLALAEALRTRFEDSDDDVSALRESQDKLLSTVEELGGHFISIKKSILKAVIETEELRGAERSRANKGRTGTRYTKKYGDLRRAIDAEIKAGRPVNAAEALEICKSICSKRPDLVLPDITLIYTWLPPKKAKKK